jgi:hypothetical protein
LRALAHEGYGHDRRLMVVLAETAAAKSPDDVMRRLHERWAEVYRVGRRVKFASFPIEFNTYATRVPDELRAEVESAFTEGDNE